MAESNTRELILSEARACFARQGFDGTSLNDIAAGVGIRRPSLMHYFPSKEAIYRQILLEALADWGYRIDNIGADDAQAGDTDAADGTESSGWDRVDRVIEASFEFFKNNPEIVRLVRREALTDASPLEFDLGTALRPFFERAVVFFSNEMDAGVFRRHDPEHLVLTGYGALLTYFSDSKMLNGLIDTDPYSPEALAARFDHIKSFIRAALEPAK